MLVAVFSSSKYEGGWQLQRTDDGTCQLLLALDEKLRCLGMQMKSIKGTEMELVI